MNFDEKDLLLAQKKGIISSETFEKLLDFLTNLNVYNMKQIMFVRQQKLR